MENYIKLNIGSVPFVIRHYKYPYENNNEIEKMVEAMAVQSTFQVVTDCIENQQEVLQIPTMSKNKMKLQEYQHRHQRIF